MPEYGTTQIVYQWDPTGRPYRRAAEQTYKGENVGWVNTGAYGEWEYKEKSTSVYMPQGIQRDFAKEKELAEKLKKGEQEGIIITPTETISATKFKPEEVTIVEAKKEKTMEEQATPLFATGQGVIKTPTTQEMIVGKSITTEKKPKPEWQEALEVFTESAGISAGWTLATGLPIVGGAIATAGQLATAGVAGIAGGYIGTKIGAGIADLIGLEQKRQFYITEYPTGTDPFKTGKTTFVTRGTELALGGLEPVGKLGKDVETAYRQIEAGVREKPLVFTAGIVGGIAGGYAGAKLAPKVQTFTQKVKGIAQSLKAKAPTKYVPRGTVKDRALMRQLSDVRGKVETQKFLEAEQAVMQKAKSELLKVPKAVKSTYGYREGYTRFGKGDVYVDIPKQVGTQSITPKAADSFKRVFAEVTPKPNRIYVDAKRGIYVDVPSAKQVKVVAPSKPSGFEQTVRSGQRTVQIQKQIQKTVVPTVKPDVKTLQQVISKSVITPKVKPTIRTTVVATVTPKAVSLAKIAPVIIPSPKTLSQVIPKTTTSQMLKVVQTPVLKPRETVTQKVSTIQKQVIVKKQPTTINQITKFTKLPEPTQEITTIKTEGKIKLPPVKTGLNLPELPAGRDFNAKIKRITRGKIRKKYTPSVGGIKLSFEKGIVLKKAPKIKITSPAKTRLPTKKMIDKIYRGTISKKKSKKKKAVFKL